MNATACPRFIYGQLPAEAGTAFRDLLVERASEEGGTVLAAVDPKDVECLETGTPEAGCVLIQFDNIQLNDSDALDRVWSSIGDAEATLALRQHPDAVVLSVSGLPYEGMPDAMEIPTTASVTPPASDDPRAFMVIQGNAYDQARIDGYRDIILPMLKALGAYYTVFDLGGDVTPLVGNWDHQIFAISRWPDHKAGHDFWDSDRYQNTAIPQRTGAGDFTVHFFTGRAG